MPLSSQKHRRLCPYWSHCGLSGNSCSMPRGWGLFHLALLFSVPGTARLGCDLLGIPVPQVTEHPLALSSFCYSDCCSQLGHDSTGFGGFGVSEDPHETDRGHITFSAVPVSPASSVRTHTLLIPCFSLVPLLSVLQWKVPTLSLLSSQSR